MADVRLLKAGIAAVTGGPKMFPKEGDPSIVVLPVLNLQIAPAEGTVGPFWSDNPGNINPTLYYTVSRSGFADVQVPAGTTYYLDRRTPIPYGTIWSVTLTTADGTSLPRSAIYEEETPVLDPIFSVDLQASLTPEIATGSSTPTFARLSEATLIDYKGWVRTVAAGTPRFLGARLEVDNTTYHTTRDDGTTPIDQTDYYADAAGPYGYVSESAATNLLLWSEEYDRITWTKTNSTITVDATTAPDGTSTADKLIDNNSTGLDSVEVRQNEVTVTSGDNCISIYAKADQLDWLFLAAHNFDTPENCYFDLTNGVVGTSTATGEGIEELGNGWYRCWIVFNTTTDLVGNVRIYIAEADGDTVVDLDGTSSIFIWGAQLEAGSFPTSYIKTEAATATRSAESLTYDDVGNIQDAAGSGFCEASTFWSVEKGVGSYQLHRGSAGRIAYNFGGDNPNTFNANDGANIASSNIAGSSPMSDGPQRITTVWGSELKCYYAIGAGVPQPYDGTMGSGDIGIGCTNTLTAQLDGTIRNVQIFDKELDESQVGQLPGPVTSSEDGGLTVGNFNLESYGYVQASFGNLVPNEVDGTVIEELYAFVFDGQIILNTQGNVALFNSAYIELTIEGAPANPYTLASIAAPTPFGRYNTIHTDLSDYLVTQDGNVVAYTIVAGSPP